MLEERSALLLFYLLFIIIVFQVQNVHLKLAIGVFELPNAVERISKGTKAVAGPGGWSGESEPRTVGWLGGSVVPCVETSPLKANNRE